MDGVILILSLICGAASLAATVCTVLILRLLRNLDVSELPEAPEAPEKVPEAPEEPTDRQKSVEQGIDNLMTYSLETMKASRKGREGESWR